MTTDAAATLDAVTQLARAAAATRHLIEVLGDSADALEAQRDYALTGHGLDAGEDRTRLADAAEEWTHRVERARAMFPTSLLLHTDPAGRLAIY